MKHKNYTSWRKKREKSLIHHNWSFTNKGNVNNEYRYELVPANENHMIILDRKTGEYWTKFIPSEEGPTNWEKGD
ncbi:hypothetical protein P4482_13680 [Neobacillus thermocopriae]|uniref:hypothetical protein n=1 Tax=Neobacillus thermocopriae TaxID=1215031 RepID=UPI002E1C6B9E|nr:hypothetical protein [Neobacillus thermocopriae]MED3715236.1 hypothetical protein [Neobacillus thermocopriae]